MPDTNGHQSFEQLAQQQAAQAPPPPAQVESQPSPAPFVSQPPEAYTQGNPPQPSSWNLPPPPQSFTQQAAQQPFTPAAPAPQEPSLLEHAASLGLDVTNIKTPQELIDRMADHYKYAQQVQEVAAFGQQMMPYAQEFQEYLASRQQPNAPAAPVADKQWNLEDHFKGQWKAPEYDSRWLDMVEHDAKTGRYVSATTETGMPITHPEIVRKVNEYADWYRSTQREFFSGNPYQRTYEAIKDPVMREVQQLVQGEFQRQQQEQSIAQFEQQHVKELYQCDQTGRPIVHPVSGQYQPSPFGARFYQHAAALRDGGLTQYKELLDQAWRAAYYDVASVQQQQTSVAAPLAPPPIAPPQQQAAPAFNPQAARAERQDSFLNQALARAQSPPSYQSAQEQTQPFVPRNMGELEGFFERAARKAGILPT